jgi:hypothetical protein
MLAQQQVHVGQSGLADTGGVGMDDHAFQNLRVTGGNQAVGAFHFYHTHTASTDLIDLLQEAQVGNGDAGLFGSFQDGGTFGHTQFAAINLEIYHL